MKLHVADFKEGVPRKVSHKYDPQQLDLEFADLKYASHLRMEGVVERNPQTLIFRGHLATEVEHLCGRCLALVKASINKPFELYYETEGKDDIETTDDLRELLLLEHPISYICRDDCKGLCPVCGANWNETTCDCQSKSQLNSFAALGRVRLKEGKEGKKHGKS